MSVLLLCTLGVLALLVSVGVLLLQKYQLDRGIIHVEDGYNGPAQVSTALLIVIRYILKRSVYFRKFFMQYMFHFMVRVMYYIDTWTTLLYAKSRNWFVENAVRNRGTVPHFWNHLKAYKKEMDEERDNEGDIK